MPRLTTDRLRPIVYISGPYRSSKGESGVWDNIMAAREATAWLLAEGFAPICPHLNTMLMGGSILPGDPVGEVDVFLEADAELVRAADAMWRLIGWQQSAGSLYEIEVAKLHDKPIFDYYFSIRRWIKHWRLDHDLDPHTGLRADSVVLRADPAGPAQSAA